MDSKLTLNVDREVAGKAKRYAKSKGRSLSSLVEAYLRFLTGPMEAEPTGLSPKVKSILGSIRVPEDFDYKKALSERIHDKYPEK